MAVLALTGGIACGKSTVARTMAALGVPVVDADQVARDVTRPGSEGLRAVLEAFGQDLTDADGALDRKRLGDRVFGDPALRERLNTILHPRIGEESAGRLQRLAGEGHGFVLYEASVVVENGAWRGFDGLVVVTAQPSVQLQRLVARDRRGEDDARARIASQWPLYRKVALARWVVDNSGSQERLLARTRELYAELVTRFGPPHRTPR
jgi:dephospho-CoA kinase